MDIQTFRSGSYREEFQYRTFQPSQVNHAWTLNDAELGTLLSQADRKLGELNAFSQLVPDVDFFIRMHVSKEATTGRSCIARRSPLSGGSIKPKVESRKVR